MEYSPRLRICRQSQYQDLLKIGKSRKGAIFLDVGSCCENLNNTSISLKKKAHIFIITVGNETRKLVADGYPLEQVVTTDLHQGTLFFALKPIDLSAYLCCTYRIRGPRA